MSESVTVFGIEWPILKALPNDWFLVSCDGGPAIARSKDFQFARVLSRGHEYLPEEIRTEAIDAYVALTWPIQQKEIK